MVLYIFDISLLLPSGFCYCSIGRITGTIKSLDKKPNMWMLVFISSNDITLLRYSIFQTIELLCLLLKSYFHIFSAFMIFFILILNQQKEKISIPTFLTHTTAYLQAK